MNKKLLKIIGVIAVILGTIILYVSGATETELTGLISAIIVVVVAVLAIFQKDIAKFHQKLDDKAKKVRDALNS